MYTASDLKKNLSVQSPRLDAALQTSNQLLAITVENSLLEYI